MTNEQIMRCIMVYPTAPILVNKDRFNLVAVQYVQDKLLLYSTKDGKAYECHVSDVQIGLRPVSSLTDEECIEVARIAEQLGIAIVGRKIAEDVVRNAGRYYISAIIDYLRSINIITTVHGFDLVAEGVAIVNSEKEGL